MGKDVVIEVPTAHLDIRANKPTDGQEATIHLVPVPEEALAEVQEVLKKYQPQLDKFNQLLSKAMESKNES